MILGLKAWRELEDWLFPQRQNCSVKESAVLMLDLSQIEAGEKDVKVPLGSKWEAFATADTKQEGNLWN